MWSRVRTGSPGLRFAFTDTVLSMLNIANDAKIFESSFGQLQEPAVRRAAVSLFHRRRLDSRLPGDSVLINICGMAGKSQVQLCGALSPVLRECEVCNRGDCRSGRMTAI